MDEARTAAAIRQYLVDLAGASENAPAEPLVSALLVSSVDRLRVLCSALLYKSYPRLTRAPLNLDADELLRAVVERLLKALGKARPETVRGFFAIANQHMRWELNDLARRVDARAPDLELVEGLAFAPESSGLTQSAHVSQKAAAFASFHVRLRRYGGIVQCQRLIRQRIS